MQDARGFAARGAEGAEPDEALREANRRHEHREPAEHADGGEAEAVVPPVRLPDVPAEQRRERSTTRFFYDHPEVQGLQGQINAILVLHYQFEREDFLRRIEDTVHLLVNFLVRPEWTLKNVLYERTEAVSTESVLRLLRHFSPYEYYRDVLTRYIEDKQITSLARGEFSSLLRKVDASFVRRKTGDELARVLLPLYEFVDYPFRTGTNAVPVKALLKFFEDKGLAQVVARLDGNRRLLADLLAEHLPDVRYTPPAATYLGWLDCRALGWGDDPTVEFARRGVRLSEGPFGAAVDVQVVVRERASDHRAYAPPLRAAAWP